MNHPTVSVMMAIYNASAYLHEAIDSILTQTFSDFEFIIVDDGSTDGSDGIVRSYDDPRIQLIQNEHSGLVTSLNLAMSHARGRYVARMDGDDRAMPQRFECQVARLESDAAVDIVCTDVFIIDGEGKRTGQQTQPGLDNDLVRDALLHRRQAKPIIHPSVMMRREVMDALGGYRRFDCAEDHDLWLRAVDRFTFARLEERLLEYRIHGGGISRTKALDQIVSSVMSEVDYLISMRTGLSVFERRPDVFRRFSETAREKISTIVLPRTMAFRRGRQYIRDGHRLYGGLTLLSALVRYGPSIMPRRIDARLRDMAVELADLCESSMME
mgnify:CR=1 FL=1